MSTIVMKLKKTNYLPIFIITILIIGQGYGLYLGHVTNTNVNTYFYSKIISNVIPGSKNQRIKTEKSLINRVITSLTEIDITSYRTLVERTIPLMKYEISLGEDEYYNSLVGFKKSKVENPKKENEDYFDLGDELLITRFESPVNLGKAVTKEELENDSYVTSKLINFDANLNFENQAMKQVDTLKLIEKRFKIDNKTPGPKVIIFHTHHHERFADEEPGDGGVVDVGRYLKDILENQYGLETLHCTSKFVGVGDDKKKDDYGRMQIEVKQILKDNPSIEVAIDIHRDAIDGSAKFLTDIDGKKTAKLMFVNGFRQVQKQGVLTPIESLPNPYVEDNMGLSLQMQLKALERYPDFIRKTLVKPYRYSLHMKPMSLLIEIGNQNNTKEEALNTMDVFAELLMEVIEKD